MDALRFFQQYVASPGRVGAILPSSMSLARVMADIGKVREASVVVEFGPGTGALTRGIVEELNPGAAFLAIEINSGFAHALRKRFPQAHVFQGCATHVRSYLREMNFEACDCIVSGLPWALFDEGLQCEVLDAAKEALRPAGVFVTFTYLHSPLLPGGKRFREKLYDRFSQVGVSPTVWRNIPPAFAYCAVK